MTFREMIRTPFSQADSKVHDVLWQSYDFHDDRTNVCGKSVTYKYLLQVSLKVVKSYKLEKRHGNIACGSDKLCSR